MTKWYYWTAWVIGGFTAAVCQRQGWITAVYMVGIVAGMVMQHAIEAEFEKLRH